MTITVQVAKAVRIAPASLIMISVKIATNVLAQNANGRVSPGRFAAVRQRRSVAHQLGAATMSVVHREKSAVTVPAAHLVSAAMAHAVVLTRLVLRVSVMTSWGHAVMR